MKHFNRFIMLVVVALVATATLASCSKDNGMVRPEEEELPDLPIVEGIHKYNAPLYWSLYEYCYDQEQKGKTNIDFTAQQWNEAIAWVATNLKPYGYNMLCTDGFCSMLATDGSVYMTQYGSMKLKDIIAKCKAKGLKLGVYDNPLWIHCDDNTKVPGTNYTVGSLKYNGSETVKDKSTADKWFKWAISEHPGCREFIDGFFKHYHDLGVEYIRMDFMSWYEDGTYRNMGKVGHGYGRSSYARALAYIAESAKKYNIFTSVVMPHLYEDALLEAKYGNMVRIVADTGYGGWNHCSDQDKGKAYSQWPNCMNQFDGFTYWSHIAGKEKVLLDGDFICLNKFKSDDEKEFVISLQLMAGGPVTVADQPSTIKDGDLRFYTNEEMLALNKDRFVGHPKSDKLNTPDSNIWYGQMKDGSYVVGLFNRSSSAASMSVKLADLGISGEMKMRDLWKHADEGTVSAVSATIPAHGCKIVKLTP